MKIINIKNKRNRSFSRFNESRYEDNMSRMWDELLMMGVSEETLTIITSINGFNEDTLKDVLYASFGERSFEFEDEDEDEDDFNESRRHRGRGRRSQNRRALIESLEDDMEGVDMEDDDMEDDDMDDSVNVDLSASDISVLKKIVAAADEDYEDDDMEDEDFEGADEGGEDFDDIEDPYNSVNLVSMEDLPEKTPSENNTYYD